MKSDSSNKRTVTTSQAIKILEKNGVNVTEKEVEKILDLMYFLAKLIVNQEVNDLPDKTNTNSHRYENS
ncbi:hypothetical protein SAMN05428975_5827 [Mucilaginibacter sp. OK268]|jgi:hypothetical protein|uniref:hypothetical protein n=1 Tax=Mucilaginibacter sp. OK268 TaxID=1881048 RepID=UPI000886D92C|nr:hypothetical protein [Mucilaginibacter sp. OK268]SDQ01481.1 hypothetical protein SAMN05428975_5827 [Mucilaginibacter sp. OK268]